MANLLEEKKYNNSWKDQKGLCTHNLFEFCATTFGLAKILLKKTVKE